jgi:hypothetical protein
MDRLTHSRNPAPWRGLALIAGGVATVAAAGLAAVLALVFAASIVVIALVASALLGVAGFAMRARRSRMAAARSRDPNVIDAHHVGGHSWVAYGYDRRR